MEPSQKRAQKYMSRVRSRRESLSLVYHGEYKVKAAYAKAPNCGIV